jgi:hypothetical protein
MGERNFQNKGLRFLLDDDNDYNNNSLLRIYICNY